MFESSAFFLVCSRLIAYVFPAKNIFLLVPLSSIVNLGSSLSILDLAVYKEFSTCSCTTGYGQVNLRILRSCKTGYMEINLRVLRSCKTGHV
jgi:hypothetical protein